MPEAFHLNKNLCRGFALAVVCCLPALSLYGQAPSIGGGSCNSGSLNGIYSVSITGRQVTAATSGPAVFNGVFQANGSATFDGLSKVTVSLTSVTNQAAGTAVSWSGGYSVQANCAGVITVSSGGGASLNLSLYDSGADFLVSGSDGTYTYSGTALAQPAGCSASTFSGVYSLTGTGFALTGTTVSGAENGTGLAQFDGSGNAIVNITTSAMGAPATALTLTGTYTASSGCLGTATLTDASSHAYTMTFSIYNDKVASTAFYAMLEGANLMIAGSGHALYGQPPAITTAALARNKAGKGGRA